MQNSGYACQETKASKTKVALKMNETPDPHEPPAITRADAATHYPWGDGCDGWRLLETPGLRVREECIPPGGGERPHLHRVGQQAFYVLSGTLAIQLPGGIFRLGPGDLLHIPSGVAHEVRNDAGDPVRFLVMTAPAVEGDREEIVALSREPTK